MTSSSASARSGRRSQTVAALFARLTIRCFRLRYFIALALLIFGLLVADSLFGGTAFALNPVAQPSFEPAVYVTGTPVLTVESTLRSGAGVSIGALSDSELRALLSAGAPCMASIYKMAWPIARASGIEPTLVAAVIEVESSCNHRAVSPDGAQGLMQLVPESGARAGYRKAYGKDIIPSIAELHDTRTNIRLGVAYLRILENHFEPQASLEARPLLAIASYNCGPDVIDRRLPEAAMRWTTADTLLWIAQHTPRQTQVYVADVVARLSRYTEVLNSRRSAFGLDAESSP